MLSYLLPFLPSGSKEVSALDGKYQPTLVNFVTWYPPASLYQSGKQWFALYTHLFDLSKNNFIFLFVSSQCGQFFFLLNLKFYKILLKTYIVLIWK